MSIGVLRGEAHLMVRFLIVLCLGLLLVQVLGATAPLESADCLPCCPGEGAKEEDCAPYCDLCACCPSVRCVLASAVQIPMDASAEQPPAIDALSALPSPHPREILHIPIRPL